MLVSRYSKPEFNPYGDEGLIVGGEAGPWAAPFATRELAASLALPGSKSLTNRELVLSALASSPSLLRAPLHSRDSALMVQALRALGTDIVELPGSGAYGADLRITPADELMGGTSIECGLAGTVMRFLPPVVVDVDAERAQRLDGRAHRAASCRSTRRRRASSSRACCSRRRVSPAACDYATRARTCRACRTSR